MHKVDDQEDRNPHIRREEAARAPLAREEDRESIQETQQREHDERDVRAVWLYKARPGRLDALSHPRFAETEIHDAAADPGDKAGGVGEVDEPVEDDAAAAAAVEVGEGAEEARGRDGVVGDAPAVAGLEDAGCAALDGKRVEAAAADVEEAVARAPGGDDDDGVDDAGQDGNAGVDDADDERGGAGAGAAVGQRAGVRGADAAEGEDGAAVEDDEAVEVALAGLGEVAAWGFHLAARHDDEFGREGEGEDGEDERFPEGDEAARVAGEDVGVCGARVFPVVEAEDAVLVGAAAPEENE